MKRILIALLLAAAPAFAHDHGRDHEDDRDNGYGYDYGYDDQDSSYGSAYDYGYDDSRSWDDSGYSDRGPTLDDFRNDSELSWNGEWVQTPEYGTVWRPTHVDEDWQPYTYGRWIWTSAGWAWASDEPFGWAVYHYGRWAFAPAVGWIWLPGRVWAPAWVSWRWTDGYAAWCPMGPRYGYVVEQPALWVVVPTRYFLEPVRHYVVPRRQRRVIPLPQRTGPRAGPTLTLVERATGRPIRPLAIRDSATPRATGAASGVVNFYRPRTAPIAVPARSQATPRAWQGGAPRPSGTSPQAQPALPSVRPIAPRPQAAPVQAPGQPAQRPATGYAPKAAAPRPTVPGETPAARAVTPRMPSGEQPRVSER